MGNNVFQSPFNITSAAINAALAGQDLNPGNVSIATGGYYAWSGRTVMRSPQAGGWSLRNFAETIRADLVTEANDVLAMQRATNPQAFRTYNTYTDGSNYERGHLAWINNVLTLDSQQYAGTGLPRGLQVSAGGSILTIEGSSALLGYSAPFVFLRNGTSASTLVGFGNTPGVPYTSTALNFIRLTPSINQASGAYNILDINPTEVSVGAGPHYLMRGRIGAGADVFNVQRDGTVLAGALVRLAGTTSSFPALKRNGASIEARLADDSAYADLYGGSLVTMSNTVFFGTGGNVSMPSDGVAKLSNLAGTSFDRLSFGGTTSSFPAIKKHASGSIFQFRKADDSAFTDVELGYVRFSAVTVAGLGAASGAGAGTVRYVTDATATTSRSVAAGGGSNKVMVWSDGTNWLIF